jgi:hypothetical protein
VLIGAVLMLSSPGLNAQSTGREFFVSPAGRSTATGTISDPLDLATALSTASPARGGDRIWLRGGTYFGTYTSYLTGLPTAPIVVRQYLRERVTINASSRTVPALTVHGADTWYWGIEVTDTNTTRVTSNYGYTPGLRATSVNVYGPRTRFINMIVHDGEQGFGFWSPAVDAEIYGTIIYNVGIETVSQGMGHSIYVQNATGTKRITDNILFNSFSMGVHAYTEAGRIDNIHVEGNIAFNHGALSQSSGAKANFYMGGEDDADLPVFRNNYGYFGPSFPGGRSLEIRPWCRQGTFVGNYMAGSTAANIYCTTTTVTGNVWAGATGFAESYPQNTTISTRPTGIQAFVRPNKYEPGRANIVIYNWDLWPSLSVDISAAKLAIGQTFEVRDAQNFFAAPVMTGTYDGSRVTLPMSFLTPATPIGNVPVKPPHTGPEFGTFVVIPTSSTGTPPPPANVPPAVMMTSPLNGGGTAAPATIALAATATDSDGTIAKVEFFAGATKLGEDLAAPFAWSWTQVPAGLYTLTAKATDDDGATTVSGAITFTVTAPTTNVRPAVTLTSPVNGGSMAAPATIALAATATDSDGTIAKVEFFAGATKLGEDLAAPFTWSWARVPAGVYTLTAKATDDDGATTISAGITFTVTASTTNAAPTVVLTSPLTGSAFTTPVILALTATATDSDGTIAKVEFFQGATKVGEDTAAPFAAIWSSMPAGSYVLTAKAIDNGGASSVSNAVTVTISSTTTTPPPTSTTNIPPVVSITSPLSMSKVNPPATVTITASASDADGSIARVEFYQGTTLLGTSLAPPYSAVATGLGPGSYTLTARAYDNRGAVTSSAAVYLMVRRPPGIALTAPRTGEVYIAPANIVFSAFAATYEGTITKVEFYSGATKIGEDTLAPYTFTWSGVRAGSYTFTAKVYDSVGGTAVSQPASVTVQ